MMRLRWIALLGLFGLVLVGCGSQPADIIVSGVTYDTEQIAQGQQIYAQSCASCHGVTGEGQFPDAPNQPDATGRIGAPPHNGNGHTWHHGDEMLIRYTREGGISLTDSVNFYPMPAFGDQLSEDEILAVLAYIKTMWNDEQRTRQQQATEAEAGG